MSVACCQVEVSALSGRHLFQRSPTECVECLTEYDSEASIMTRPRPTRAVAPCRKKIYIQDTEIKIKSHNKSFFLYGER